MLKGLVLETKVESLATIQFGAAALTAATGRRSRLALQMQALTSPGMTCSRMLTPVSNNSALWKEWTAMPTTRLEVGDPETRTVRVLSRPCDTCVTFPDDRMHLGDKRRQAFIQEALDRDGFITCHDTLPYAATDCLPAICRGFWNLHRNAVTPLRVVQVYGMAVEVDPPEKT